MKMLRVTMSSHFEQMPTLKILNPIRLMTLIAVLLFTVKANAQTEGKPYYPLYRTYSMEMSKIRAHIGELLKKDISIYDRRNNLSAKPDNILVFEDRIEFKLKSQNTVVYFSDLLSDNVIEAHEKKTVKKENSTVTTHANLRLGNFTFSCFNNETIMQLADDLCSLQFHLNETRFASELTRFVPIAAQYRTLSIKPAITEEQRKYIVQANGFNDEKQYTKAIGLYLKAIEVDQTAYPPAYSNLALLFSQVKRYDSAIYYMKKYLMLEPEAEDARGAQDKIYLWEARLTQ